MNVLFLDEIKQMGPFLTRQVNSVYLRYRPLLF